MLGPAHIAILLATGVGVGFAQGSLGLGGSFIMTPVTLAIFTGIGVPVDAAVKLAFGTSLAVVFVTAIGSSLAHHRRGAVWWRAAVIFGVTGVAGAALGSTVTTRFIHGHVLKVAFGGLVMLAAARLLTAKPPQAEDVPRDTPLLWAACGLPLGLVYGLIAIGGGIVTVPLMTLGLRFGVHRAVATSTALMMFTAGAAALGYVLNGIGSPGLPDQSIGYVHLLAWVCLAGTSLPMSQIGARVAHRLTERVLRTVFVVVMFYLGLRMVGLFESLGWPL